MKLSNQLEQQFAHFVHPNHNTFNSLYLSATTIDPHYCLISEKVQKQAEKYNLNDLLKVSSPAVIDTTHMDGENEKECRSDESPPLKHFKYLSEILSIKLSQIFYSTEVDYEKEINHYFTNLSQFSTQKQCTTKEDPVDYWVRMENMYINLSKLAADILCIPASSIPVERMFLVTGYSCICRRKKSLLKETSAIYLVFIYHCVSSKIQLFAKRNKT